MDWINEKPWNGLSIDINPIKNGANNHLPLKITFSKPEKFFLFIDFP